MQKTQSTEADPKSTHSYVTASKYGTETKLVNKLGKHKIEDYSQKVLTSLMDDSFL